MGWVLVLRQWIFWWLPGCISLYSLCWPEMRSCAAPVQFDTNVRGSPAVQTGNDTPKGKNPIQKVHLHHCDWKQPDGFVGQSFPKFIYIGGGNHAPPRAAPACRAWPTLVSSLPQLAAASQTCMFFLLKLVFPGICYDDNYAMGWWSSTFLD